MNKKSRTLIVRFGNEISQRDILLFRGAIIKATESSSILFHNHVGDGLRYAYPLIQYKRIGGKAAIVCIGEGTEAIGEFFANCNFDVSLANRPVHLEIEKVQSYQTLVQVWNDEFVYSLRKWLPLNQENYEKYLHSESIVEKYAMLEKTLVGNILSFAKGIDIHFDKEVMAKIQQIKEPRLMTHKGVRMMSFDLVFRSNVSLPDFIGLGKGVSLGFGVVTKKIGNNEIE